jgi:hypothetical protein
MVIARVLRVSVDLCATIQTPVSLQTVVGTAGAMLCDLLGLTSVPQIKVFADPLFEQGRRIREGRLVEDDALAAETVGGRMSAGYFEFRIPETGDSAWFFVAADEGKLDAVFSPTRTCVGVVLATALALATAHHGRGAPRQEQPSAGSLNRPAAHPPAAARLTARSCAPEPEPF